MGVSTADDASWETIANNIKSISKGYTQFEYENAHSSSWPTISSSKSSSSSGTIEIVDNKATVYILAKGNTTSSATLTFS